MNTETGKLITEEELIILKTEDSEAAKKYIKVNPTKKQIIRGKVRLSEKCPCGSGKKFRRCCFAFKNKASRVKR